MSFPVRYIAELTIFFRIVLAGLIALATSLYFNLPYPSWGLLTIAFLAMKVELGNIYIKSLARIAGTVIGGVVGALITIAFGQYPPLLIVALSLVVLVCVSFTSRYQAMAGYASFLACITCLMVPLFTLNTSDQATIGYFTIYRISEICLGVTALLISSMVIWPSSSQDRLAHSLAALRSHLGRLTAMAGDPEQYQHREFIGLHTQLGLMVIDCDQQRYYTAFLDNRIGYLSGSLQRVTLSTLNLLAALTTQRRVLVRQKASPEQCQAIRDGVAGKCANLDTEMAHLIHLLGHPEKIRHQKTEPDHNPLLNLQNWRITLYDSLTAVVSLVISLLLWLATGMTGGPMLVLGALMMTLAKVLARAPRVPLTPVMKAILIAAALNFVTQYVLLAYVNSFWPFFLLTVPVLAFVIVTVYRKPSITGLLCALLFPILMPISTVHDMQPLVLLNNVLSMSTGFFIGYLCIEVIGSPNRATLCRDYLQTLSALMKRTMSRGADGITPPLFRRQILPLNSAMLMLFPQQQGLILDWMDTLASLGSTWLRLQRLEHNPLACRQSQTIFNQAHQQMAWLVNQLHLPETVMSAADQERQQQLDSLFDQALQLYDRDQHLHNLDLLILCGCLRHHHELSFKAEETAP